MPSLIRLSNARRSLQQTRRSGLPGLEAIPGIGPHRARLIKGLLDQFGLLPGPNNLQAAVEHLFPEFSADQEDLS